MKAAIRLSSWYVQVAVVIGSVACAPKEASLGNDVAGGAGGQSSSSNGGAASTQPGLGGQAATTYPAELIADASSNKTYQGGYVYTFLDRSGKSMVAPYTGKLDPLDTTTIPAMMARGIEPGNGIENDETGNSAFHVIGAVGMDPAYDSLVDDDRYWDLLLGSRCLNQTCQVMLWPEAGLELSLTAHGQPPGLEQYLGVGFRMRAGTGHGTDMATGAPIPIEFAAPMDTTDIPDPTFLEEFGVIVNGQRTPLCRFPGSDRGDGQPAGSTGYTCLLHFSTEVVPATGYQNLCFGWSEFQPPAWPTGNLANAGITALDPARIIKLRWKVRGAPYQATTEGVPPTNPFDFWLDDVWLLTCQNWTAHCPGKALPAACQ